MKHNEKTLIVSGLGVLEEYLFAAAIALRTRPGAEIAFASRSALPGVLADRTGPARAKLGEALLLGMGLGADPAGLAAALGVLRRAGTKVVWISAADFPVPETLPPETRALFEARVLGDDLPRAVAEALGGGTDDLLDLHDAVAGGAAARTSAAKAWRERIDAAEWDFANSRDFAPLEGIVRDLAGRIAPERWGAEARRLAENFRAFGYRRLQTASPAMRRLRKDIARVARSGAMRVLVTGESGVGKETVAQQIHVQSGRRGPFLAFNCATVAKDLLESRLFGHAKGAFTGAMEARPGLFREADGGTLFLDEIAELPPDLQGALLRALQEGRVQPVGEPREIAVDVRVVAATNRDLEALVRAGRFRADLYWRLSAVELAVPPLRERTADFAAIARDLWRSFAPRHGALAEADLALLAAWDWPGNVRQLANVLERAALFEDRTIAELLEEEKAKSERLRGELGPDGTGPCNARQGTATIGTVPATRDAPLDEVVRAHVRGVWERHGRNASEAARILGISRNTLRTKLG
jgi:DNA-binding NtrC family response regulator